MKALIDRVIGGCLMVKLVEGLIDRLIQSLTDGLIDGFDSFGWICLLLESSLMGSGLVD